MEKSLEKQLLILAKQELLANENKPRGVGIFDIHKLVNKGFLTPVSIMPDYNGSTIKYKLSTMGINRLNQLTI
jgi:hypothetical protein